MKVAAPFALPPKLRILGVTGNIACGKSTVVAMLAEKGVPVLDSDALVHDLYADAAFAIKVARLFTQNILDGAGQVDRRALGQVVFNDPVALRRLEALVHPAVAELRHQRLLALPPTVDCVVSEAVKLLESGQGKECHEIWNVSCAPDVQLKRLIELRGLTQQDAELRLKAQPSRERKSELAGEVPLVWIENNGSLHQLRATVENVWSAFRRRALVSG